MSPSIQVELSTRCLLGQASVTVLMERPFYNGCHVEDILHVWRGMKGDHSTWTWVMSFYFQQSVSKPRWMGLATKDNGKCKREGWLTSGKRLWGTWPQAIVHTAVMMLTCFMLFIGSTTSKVQVAWDTALPWAHDTTKKGWSSLQDGRQSRTAPQAMLPSRSSTCTLSNPLVGHLLKRQGVWRTETKRLNV